MSRSFTGSSAQTSSSTPANVTALEADVATLNASMTATQGSMGTAQADISVLQTNVGVAEADITALETSVLALQSAGSANAAVVSGDAMFESLTIDAQRPSPWINYAVDAVVHTDATANGNDILAGNQWYSLQRTGDNISSTKSSTAFAECSDIQMNGVSISGSESFTLAFEIRIASTTADKSYMIIGNADPAGTAKGCIGVSFNGMNPTWYNSIHNDKCNRYPALTANQLYFVVLSYDAGTDTAKCYYDGVEQSPTLLVGGGLDMSGFALSAPRLRLGYVAETTLGPRHFYGGEFEYHYQRFFWGHAVSAAEAARIMDPPLPLALYPPTSADPVNIGSAEDSWGTIHSQSLVVGNASITGLGNYADDAAASTGGVALSSLYRNGSELRIRTDEAPTFTRDWFQCQTSSSYYDDNTASGFAYDVSLASIEGTVGGITAAAIPLPEGVWNITVDMRVENQGGNSAKIELMLRRTGTTTDIEKSVGFVNGGNNQKDLSLSFSIMRNIGSGGDSFKTTYICSSVSMAVRIWKVRITGHRVA